MASSAESHSTSHWRIRSVLMVLVLACIVPGVVGTAVLISYDYQHRQQQLNENLISRARAMVQSVDSQLLRTRALAQVLASFGGVPTGDLSAFHARARLAISDTGLGLNVVLTDRSGQQILNTIAKLDQPLPMHGDPAAIQQVFATAQPVISGLYTGAHVKELGIHISVPVIDNQEVTSVLSVGVLASEFDDVLIAQNFPAEWVAAVFDNSGTIVARTHSPEIFVGQKGPPDYIRNISQALEGVTRRVSPEGFALSSVWSRSATTDWSVGIGIPTALVETELRRDMTWLAAAAIVLLGITLTLAFKVARNITDSVQALKAPALAMGEGEILPEPLVSIEEVAQVINAIHKAATLLKRRSLDLELAQRTNMRELERQVDDRTQDLLQANHKLEQVAITDDLTGLQNRKAVYARLRQEFLRLKRSGRGYAVLYLDIDHFKHINDTFGHETGDQVLCQVAEVLVASMRESDLVARHGGEEFLIVLQDTDMAGALTLAEKIRLAVSSHEFPLVRQVTVSIGVTIAACEDSGGEDAVRRADAALYQAKAEGRNRVCSRTPD